MLRPMTETRNFVPPEIWMLHLFSSKAAREGGIVRRKVRDVERTVGRDMFLSEIRRRGYRAVENGGQIIVFCNNDQIKRLV